MSNEVKFNIKLVVDGKEKIVDATADIKKFAQEFENARTESTKVRDELLKFTQTSQSIQNVITGMQQLTGVMRTYTAANSVQVEAETKLAVNMRNTMGAREEDIQSIKDLCSAQQQLGVIGDEVQLSGAQELATYLEKKSSLEKLIPVMNDMVAQQYGLNATEESATTIATMLGKVMEGQVGALSRYGYSFDKAQEEILKFGTEEQRVAVLSEVVESSVGGMNAELAKTDAGKAKQVSNTIGDLKEQVGALFSSVEPLIVGVGELGVAFMSLGTTYSGLKGMVAGVKNLTSALRVSTVTAYAHSVAMKASSSGIAVWRSVSVGAVAMTRALTAAFHGATVGATTLKVAIRGLMTATGVGVAVAALTLAIEKLFFSEEAALLIVILLIMLLYQLP